MHDHSRHSIEVTVDGLSPKGFGKALWKKEGSLRPCTVLIPGGLPGDQLLVEICGRKKREYLGKLVNVLGPSLQRVEPRCKHVPVCGGCTLQAMSYEDQVRYKEHLILELFTPLGVQSIFPLVRDEDPWRYRNKMEFTFSQDVEGNRYLGLIRAGSKGRVEQLKECHLCPKWVESLLQRVYIWWQQSSLQAFHPNKGTGTLRTLIVREGRNTGQKMVMLTVSGNPAFACTKQQVQEFVRAVTEEMHEPVSLFLRIQQAIPGKETQFYEIHLAGQSYIEEKMQIFVEKMQRSLLFAISPTAFFQPNSRQSERLYTRALEMVGFVPRKRIMDLYAGTATLGILFAPMAEKVLSIEINPYAVFDAERNRELNDSDHVEIMKGDVAEVLQECLRKDPSWKEVDLVLLDPPRTGLMPKALGILMQIAPKEILYISCSPLTQARDCLLLQKEGYQIIAVQPVDQFPHTVHIENIVYLQRG